MQRHRGSTIKNGVIAGVGVLLAVLVVITLRVLWSGGATTSIRQATIGVLPGFQRPSFKTVLNQNLAWADDESGRGLSEGMDPIRNFSRMRSEGREPLPRTYSALTPNG